MTDGEKSKRNSERPELAGSRRTATTASDPKAEPTQMGFNARD